MTWRKRSRAWLGVKASHVFRARACSGRARGPTGGLNAELLCVLGVQSLPAAELHGLGADDASNGPTGEKPLQHIEADVPARSAHRYESTVDVVPKREPSAAASQPMVRSRLRAVTDCLRGSLPALRDPAGQGGRLPDPRRHLHLVELVVLVDVEV